MWGADRWLGKWPAIAVGGCAFAYIAYSMVSGIVYCSAEPVYSPPTEAEAALGSEGAMRFNCDGPGGFFDYLYLYIIAPVILIVIGLMVGRALKMRTQ